ncbi:hypothetical protein [Sulfurisphaera ohwakuensis]|uniref:Putative P-loop ATPase/GTPase n=1 Tax=Sulfurisphaera ohwakuensis TaxID=69656 RepID=A0A650CIX5_SULOH|nr:hypothetical protein [Sulfurisphaera ohwakuensis]MBB5253418.1 putative P-loop ATPase/GTPase [Sulfurisphaera ohwakuensis]QGR17733.1 hypothetical protein D1869_11520 [Sulfurisphaera ohwakuensis]
MRILINGLLQFDSGKTTFSLHLLRELRNIGYDFRPLKPVAGHNVWYSFSTLLRSRELKILAGNDALKYYDETGIPVEEINPFAILFSPPDIEKVQMNIRLYNELINAGVPVMIRYYDCNKVYHLYSSVFYSIIPDSIRNPLEEFLEEVHAMETQPEKIRELIDSSPILADNCVSKFINSNVIIESYNDALAPTTLSTKVDLVFAVFPGKVFLLQDFNKVIQLFSSPPWNIKVSTFIKYSKVLSWKIYPAVNVIDKSLIDFISNKIEEEEKYKS